MALIFKVSIDYKYAMRDLILYLRNPDLIFCGFVITMMLIKNTIQLSYS